MTRDDIIRMAREAGFARTKMHPALERFAALVAAAEREACAKLCEFEPIVDFKSAADCAHLIRERGRHD
jgi:hypothetical protein